MAKSPTSPISTGGAGGDFEQSVGAYYLSALLCKSAARGHHSGVVTNVQFQRLFAGEPLDDLVVLFELPHFTAKLSIQVKRDLTFSLKNNTDGTESTDTIFKDVVTACWSTFVSDKFDAGRDQFGIGLNLYSKIIDEHYQSVLSWARTSSTSNEFLTRLKTKGLSNQYQRTFVTALSKLLGEITGKKLSNEDVWGFFKSMLLLRFDFHQEGSSDKMSAIQLLSSRLPASQRTRAGDLFLLLKDCAAEGMRTAGEFTLESLEKRVSDAGFSLEPASDCRSLHEKMQDVTNAALADIKGSVGGLQLERGDIVNEIEEKTKHGGLQLIVGQPGVGKSAVLKSIAQRIMIDRPVLCLSGKRLSGNSWQEYATLSLSGASVAQICRVLSISGNITIFIDSLDAVTSTGNRNSINDLFRSLANFNSGKANWTVVATLRDDNFEEVSSWIDQKACGAPLVTPVPELDDEELATLLQNNPRLIGLLSHIEMHPVLKNLFLLSQMENEWIQQSMKDSGTLISELDFSNIWWHRFVGRDGALGSSRQHLMLTIGRMALSETPPWAVISEAAEALASLEYDQLLLREGDRDLFRFQHDLIEDWVLCRILDQRLKDLPALLLELGQPSRLLRPMRLLGCWLLERDNTTKEWREVFSRIEAEKKLYPRWRQSLLISPVYSTKASALLECLQPILLENEAAKLRELLVLLQTVEVTPDDRYLPFLKDDIQAGEDPRKRLMWFPVPRWRSWIPAMRWLVPRLETLPITLRDELVQVMNMWVEHTPYHFMFRKACGEVASKWLEAVSADSDWLDDEDDDNADDAEEE